jgi:hypothetical protein
MSDVDKRIIYKEGDSVAVMMPSPNCLEKYTIHEIAQKDVPHGRSYKIIHKAELPDHQWFQAWEIADDELIDGEGAESDEFEEQR